MRDSAILIIGMLMLILFGAILNDIWYGYTSKLIANCEKDLPRNENCKLIAVKKETNNDN